MPIISVIDSAGSVRMNVSIIGSCASIEQSAIFDSGFSGDIVIPQTTAVGIGLEHGGVTTVELADGFTQDFPIYLCEVDIGGITQHAAVIIMGNEVLIGMGLMEPFKLCMQKSTGEVIVEPAGSYANFVGMMGRITG